MGNLRNTKGKYKNHLLCGGREGTAKKERMKKACQDNSGYENS